MEAAALHTAVLDTALQKLRLLTGIRGQWTDTPGPDSNPDRKPGSKPDSKSLEGTLLLTINDQDITVRAKVSHHLNPVHPGGQEPDKHPTLLIAYRLPDSQKELLRQLHQPYLEANGNFYFRDDNHLLFIDGQPPLKAPKATTQNRAFAKTGLKVVFNLLLHPEWLALPYRQLAEKTGTGIGNLTNILNGLKEAGFLLQAGKGDLRFRNQQNLLQQWMEAYDRKLKPALALGSYRFLDNAARQQWRNLPLNPPHTVWGGEPAGDLLTNYLKPQLLTLYTTEKPTDLVRRFRMIPDPKGPVRLFEKFWTDPEPAVQPGPNDQPDPAPQTAPPILVYADLLNTHDPRCRETAQLVYGKYIQDQL